jgi:peptidoglycan/LPS O-acetylase OafA/YrhL
LTDPTQTADPGKQHRLATGVPVVPVFDGYRTFGLGGFVLVHVLIFSGALRLTGSATLVILAQGTLTQLLDVLFIVSGFLLFLPTVARGGDFGSTRGFAIRRVSRLLPTYWAMLAIILLILAVVPLDPPATFPRLGSIGMNATFLEVPAAMAHRAPLLFGFGVDAPVWTLSLEVVFYALLPLVAAWYARRPFVGLIAAAVVTTLWHEAILHINVVNSLFGLHLSPADSAHLQAAGLFQFPFYAVAFVLGMTGAWLYVRLRDAVPAELLYRHATRVQAISVAVLAVFAYAVGRGAATSALFPGAPEVGQLSPVLALGYQTSLATLMVSIALGGPRVQWLFVRRPVRWLADISYGIYIVHMTVAFCALHALSFAADGSVRAVVALGAVTVTGSVLYGYATTRLLERPMRRWAVRRFDRRAEPAPKPEAVAVAPGVGA